MVLVHLNFIFVIIIFNYCLFKIIAFTAAIINLNFCWIFFWKNSYPFDLFNIKYYYFCVSSILRQFSHVISYSRLRVYSTVFFIENRPISLRTLQVFYLWLLMEYWSELLIAIVTVFDYLLPKSGLWSRDHSFLHLLPVLEPVLKLNPKIRFQANSNFMGTDWFKGSRK